MVHEINDLPFLKKVEQFIRETGKKTIISYLLLASLFLVITLTFFLTQQRQNITSKASYDATTNTFTDTLDGEPATPVPFNQQTQSDWDVQPTATPTIVDTTTTPTTTEATPTSTPTFAPSNSPTPTAKPSTAPTSTPTIKLTRKPTKTHVPTATPTKTPTPFPTSTPTPTPLPLPTATTKPTPTGDMNGDSIVNVQDLSYMLTRWKSNDSKADLNKDGTVNTLDLSVLLNNWK